MRNQIVLYLLKIGVRPHYKGFNYLITAITIALESNKRIPMLEIYEMVGRAHNVDAKRVERCIRTLVGIYYDSMEDAPRCRYTNSEFIYLCSEQMKLQEAKEG